MRSNFAPRLGVRRESVFDVLERARPPRPARRDRPPARPVRRGRGPLGHLRAADRARSTTRSPRRRARVVEEEDPDLLVLQLLAADQLGHVRGVRNREYLDQLAETDRHVGDFLAFLDERGKLDGATVILMADHGQGRGIGGHGHLDWGERPVPFVVWGEGAVPGAVSREPRSVSSWRRPSPRLLGVRAPEAARGRPLVPGGGPGGGSRRAPGRPLPGDRVARDEEARVGAVLARHPGEACGHAGRRAGRRRRLARRHAGDRARAGRAGASRTALARARRRPAHRARHRARRGLRRRRLPRRRRRVRPRRLRARARARSRAAAPTTCSARASSAGATA